MTLLPEALASDLRFAGRMLRKSPAFTLVAVLVISLGVGAVTTVSSAMNALLLRPLPGTAEPERLVTLERMPEGPDGDSLSASYRYYDHLRRSSRTLDGLAAWTKVELTVGTADAGTGGAVPAYGSIVSGNYFEVLGVRPLLGRFFAPEEGGPAPERPAIVVSEGFWRSRLGADPGAVGRTVPVNGRPYTLVGVAPADFHGVFTPIREDAWVPLGTQPHLRPRRDLGSPTSFWLRTFGRLEPGVSRQAAEQELVALTAAWIADGAEPADYEAWSTVRLSGMTGLPADAGTAVFYFLSLLLGAAGLVLLIASVNVAAMLSARGVARRRELAVRTALGAGRGRLARQLLVETLLLFLLGAGGGLLLAVTATRALTRLPIPGDVPLVLDLVPDLRVAAFALAVSLATGLVFGLAPALQAARKDVTARLRDGSAGAGRRRSRLGNALIVGQLAASLLLLVAAGLFLRALERGQRIDPGFDPTGVATIALNAESWGYDEAEARAFFAALRDDAAALPGVSAVSYAGFLPLAGGSSGDRIELDGDEEPREVAVQIADVGVGYFSVLRLPIVRGRPFLDTDREGAPRVAVVNETLVRRHFADGDALGRTFHHRGEPVTVVGVARDAKYATLSEETPAFVYFPVAQLWRPELTLMVRTATDPRGLGPALERAVAALAPGVPRPALVTLEEATAVMLLPQRVAAGVTGALGAAGLLLAAVGLYGIIAFSVSQRTREIGIRVALGARRRDVLGMVAGEGLRLVAVAVAIGLALAAAVTRLLDKLLFGLSPLDAATFVGMAGLFVTVALLASYLAARRAAAADPMTVLSSE